MNKGKFIVFEGIDGAGKSTQIKRLSLYLKNANQDVHATAEPSNGYMGKIIRQILSGSFKTDKAILPFLFAADRMDHLVNEKNGIKKQIDSGNLVLCDRYYFSSYAYHALDMDMNWVIQLNLPNSKILKPDLTIFIDVKPEKCFDRIKNNRRDIELFEQPHILKQVRKNYFKAFDILKDKEKVIIIDGNDDVENVGKKILQAIKEVKGSHKK